VPYPFPASEAATAAARGNRAKDTRPEVTLRAVLHGLGLRFRKNYLVDTGEFAVRVDIAFTRARLAVFVDGCFWHGCALHQRLPRRNEAYWGPKLARNVERDRRVDEGLAEAGWRVRRVWEHEPAELAGRDIARELRQTRAESPPP
jgi:DNA mismatch endonuclease (patch repair protein)